MAIVVLGQTDNPRLQHPVDANGVASNPANYPVISKQRPDFVSSLLTHQEVVYSDWEYDIENRQLFYVQGISTFLRLFPGSRVTLLKTGGYIDSAEEVIRRDTAWPEQIALKWDEGVAANQLRRIRGNDAVYLQKAVQTVVACETMLKARRDDMSPYWVYDYMRIVPAVYNIDGFNEKKLLLLESAYPNLKPNILNAARQTDAELLDDMAAGWCVSGETATLVKDYLDKHCRQNIDHSVGGVRFHPGKKRLGRKHASKHESLDLT